MDISYLIWLQGIREALPPVVEQFFVIVSSIAVNNALVVIPCILFWCIDKRAGQFVLFSFSMGVMCNQLIKNTVCRYRPWIRSAEVRPSQEALAEATGYSFPSGHTQASVNLFGSLGWYFRKRSRLALILCWLFVLLVAFSRNLLGVHTPQDVLVGLLEGILIIAATSRLVLWVDGADGRDLRVLVVALVLAVLYFAYITLKPYPLDYDSAGNLLVDPVLMQVDCYKSVGLFAGCILGWFLERRILSFDVNPKEMGWKWMARRFAIGIAVVLVFYAGAKMLVHTGMSEGWCELVKSFSTALAAVFLAPAAFCAVERKHS